jgi:hypothetical protein
MPTLKALPPPGALDEIGLPRDELGDFTTNGSPRCKGILANGKRCRAFRGKRGFCFHHDPGITDEQRRRARVRGGQHTSTIARTERLLPPRLKWVYQLIEQSLDEVYKGTLAPARAQAIASLAGAAVKTLEAGEQEDKLRRLEAVAGGGDLEGIDLDAVDCPASALDPDGEGGA